MVLILMTVYCSSRRTLPGGMRLRVLQSYAVSVASDGAGEADHLVYVVVRVHDEGHLLQLRERDREADAGDGFTSWLDSAGETAVQIIGLVDDDLRVLAVAVLSTDQHSLG